MFTAVNLGKNRCTRITICTLLNFINMTATILYEGDLRCRATHTRSNSTFETDAPVDNRGKGEKFSPTDTLCVSLATCMITTMGIKATDMGLDLRNSGIEVTKHMKSDPRRVGKIEVVLNMKCTPEPDERSRKILESTGDNCPVMKSIHPEVEVVASYNW